MAEAAMLTDGGEAGRFAQGDGMRDSIAYRYDLAREALNSLLDIAEEDGITPYAEIERLKVTVRTSLDECFEIASAAKPDPLSVAKELEK